MPPKRSLPRRSRSPSPAKSLRSDPPLSPIEEFPSLPTLSVDPVLEAEKAMAEGFEEDAIEEHKWSSKDDVVVPYAPQDMGLQPLNGSDDLSYQLAKKFGCSKLYWRDVPLDGHRMEAVLSAKMYLDNQFASIKLIPFVQQRFNQQQLKGLHVLLPIMPVSKCYMQPYGTIDGDPNGKYALGKNGADDKDKAKLQVSVRPSAYNNFTTTDDGEKDLVALHSFMWLQMALDPLIRGAMAVGANTGNCEWSRIGSAKTDVTSLALHLDANLFRYSGFSEEELAALGKDWKVGYKAYTETLTKLCHRKVVMMNDPLIAYRVTTPEERDTLGLLAKLSWLQQSMLAEGDEIMPLVPLGGLKKGGAAHTTADLGGFIWFGPSTHYAAMKANTVEEKLRLVPPFPIPPTLEQMYQRKEKQVHNLTLQAKLAEIRASRLES